MEFEGLICPSCSGSLDEKLLAVPIENVDPNYNHWYDLTDIPKVQLDMIKHFFEHYYLF